MSPTARIVIWLGLGLASAVSVGSHAAEPDAGFSSFRLVQSRNVFDPDRRAPRAAAPVRESVSPAREDIIMLTGTMVQPDRALAFFGGSRPEYRKVLGLASEVAGYTLVSITSSHVELERDGEQLRLRVGHGLRRQGDGAWETTNEIPPPGSSPPATIAGPASGDAPSGGAISDLMKRMMQRRQQEVSR
jgi:hypothetical protein